MINWATFEQVEQGKQEGNVTLRANLVCNGRWIVQHLDDLLDEQSWEFPLSQNK